MLNLFHKPLLSYLNNIMNISNFYRKAPSPKFHLFPGQLNEPKILTPSIVIEQIKYYYVTNTVTKGTKKGSSDQI